MASAIQSTHLTNRCCFLCRSIGIHEASINSIYRRVFLSERKKSSVKIFKNWTIVDFIVGGIFINFLFLGSSGFIFPFVLDGDPIHYIFIDVPEKTTTWYLVKFALRPIWWGTWTFYCMWTFYAVTGYIFFAILHG